MKNEHRNSIEKNRNQNMNTDFSQYIVHYVNPNM